MRDDDTDIEALPASVSFRFVSFRFVMFMHPVQSGHCVFLCFIRLFCYAMFTTMNFTLPF